MTKPSPEAGRRPINRLWEALWRDLHAHATTYPSGLLIITRHRYAIEAEAEREAVEAERRKWFPVGSSLISFALSGPTNEASRTARDHVVAEARALLAPGPKTPSKETK